MMKPFDLHGLKTYELQCRPSKVFVEDLGQPVQPGATVSDWLESLPQLLAGKDLRRVRDHLARAVQDHRTVVAALGGHVIKTGCGPYLVDWINRGILRAVVLKSESSLQSSTNRGGWTFSVKEQINGAGSNSRLAGAAAVSNGTNSVPSLFLLDAERKALTLCERDQAGVWQVVRNISLPVSDFNGLQPVSFAGSNGNAVAFLGLNAVGWPEDVCVEIRLCSGCGHAIAAKAPSPGYAGPPRA